MTALGPDSVLLAFVLFCRIGGCLMLMPGFSSPRVPMQVRLLVAIAVTIALAPMLLPSLRATVPQPDAGQLAVLVAGEVLTGALIGMMGRMFFLALQFMAVGVANFFGFGNLPGLPIEDTEPNPPLANLITLTATILFFTADLHWEVLRSLVQSYSVLPISASLTMQRGLPMLTDAISDAFFLALQISSPFVVYALIINLMFGLANKLTPQVPVYFISLPFVIAGGLILLYFTLGEALRLFIDGFASWLIRA